MSELNEISQLYARLKEVRELEKDALEQAKSFTQAAQRLEESIGEMFSAYGIAELTMDDGVKVALKTSYYGTVKQENIEQIRAMLERLGSADLLKPKKMSISEKDISSLPEDLKAKVTYEIHAQTLKAYLKELDGRGELTQEVRDMFAVHQINTIATR